MKTLKTTDVVNDGMESLKTLHPAIQLLRIKSQRNLHWTEWLKIDKEFREVPSDDPKVRWKMERTKQYHNGVILYHGTSLSNAGIILARQGLVPTSKINMPGARKHSLVSHGQMFGDAIYLGAKHKASVYTTNYYDDFGVLIIVSANLGRVYHAPHEGDYRTICDTVNGIAGLTTGINRADEYAVYDRRRVKINGFEIMKF